MNAKIKPMPLVNENATDILGWEMGVVDSIRFIRAIRKRRGTKHIGRVISLKRLFRRHILWAYPVGRGL